MRTRLIITDSNIFIDLLDIGLLAEFFRLDLEIHTTSMVIRELFPEQRKPLTQYHASGKLIIDSISGQEIKEIYTLSYPKSLSITDKSVLYIASKIKAIILTGDKAMRNHAKRENLEYHGILWLFDQLVASKILSGSVAGRKINLLVSMNIVYRNNEVLMAEIHKRIKKWRNG